MPRKDNISKIEELAASQWGMFTTAQAANIGIRRNQILRMVRANRIEPVCYGVYRFIAGDESPDADIKAAWLSVYPKITAYERMSDHPYDAIVAGTTAACLLGAGDFYASPYTFILQRRKNTSRDDVRYLHGSVDEQDVTRHHALPVTTFERTVYDLLRLNTDPDHVDKFIQDASRKQLHVFNEERLALLLSPLAARYGYKRNDGESFARDLIVRNTSAIQIAPEAGLAAEPFNAYISPAKVAGISTAFDASGVFSEITPVGPLIDSIMSISQEGFSSGRHGN